MTGMVGTSTDRSVQLLDEEKRRRKKFSVASKDKPYRASVSHLMVRAENNALFM